ncbi:MAG TPA: hypothetical protein VIJ35_11370, partial [Bradyrhizobium sp.]
SPAHADERESMPSTIGPIGMVDEIPQWNEKENDETDQQVMNASGIESPGDQGVPSQSNGGNDEEAGKAALVGLGIEGSDAPP